MCLSMDPDVLDAIKPISTAAAAAAVAALLREMRVFAANSAIWTDRTPATRVYDVSRPHQPATRSLCSLFFLIMHIAVRQ